ncbi:uncharacterized protein [Mytilus edulis]|uniref:uncharacterized protein n=1 Tax=Mytilus edulis TaxID=6550 RepID=UPI0039EF3BCA
MSTQICYQFCSKQPQSFRYFATENGNECYCGNGRKLGTGVYKLSSGCTTVCRNNSHDICGGIWQLSVYDMNTGKQTINGVLTKNKIAFKCSHHAGTKDISVTLQHSSVTCKSNATTTKRRLSFSTNEVYTGRDYCYLLENSVEFGDDLSCYEPIFATLNYSCVENLATAIRDDTRNKDEHNGTGLIIGAIGGLSTIVIAALLLLALRLHMGNRENQTKSLSSVRNTKSSPVKPSSEELVSYTDLQSQSGSRPYSILNTSTQQSDINRPNVRETSKGSSTSNDYEDIQHQSKNEHYEDTHHMQRTESDHEYSDLYDKNEIV